MPRGPLAATEPADVPVPPYLPDTWAVRADIARHYDNLAQLDRQVGEVLDALDASGQADNTVVLFLADHGRGLPREKRWCYPAGLHMPLLVRAPGRLEAGSVSDRLVSWVDVAPTILALAGVEPPEAYAGSAFFGFGRTGTSEPRRHVFAGRDRMGEAFDRVRCATDGRYHYVLNFFPQIPYAQRIAYMEKMPTMQELRRLHAAGKLVGDAAVFMQPSKPDEELYDLRQDPACIRNRADDPTLASVKAELAAALASWLESAPDLGAMTERELIDRGLVANRLDACRQRVEPLPPEHQIGYPLTVVEPADLDALEPLSSRAG